MESTIDQALQRAIEAHKSGRLQEAEQVYRGILQVLPQHPDANHNLGILAVEVGKPREALPYLKAALEADRSQGQFWISYINALIDAKQISDASITLEEGKKIGLSGKSVTQIEQRLSEEYKNASSTKTLKPNRKSRTGNVKTSKVKVRQKSTSTLAEPSQEIINEILTSYKAGNFDVALRQAKSLTENYPNHPLGWTALGVALKSLNRLEDALEVMRQSVKLSPNDPIAQYNLATVLKDLRQFDEATKLYRSAIIEKPDFVEAYSNLGITLQALGQPAEAEKAYREAIRLEPSLAETYSRLGITLQVLGRPEEAEKAYREAIRIKPSMAQTYVNLGVTVGALGRPEEAENAYREAIRLEPSLAEAYSNLSVILRDFGKTKEAEENCREAIRLKPGFSEAHNNLGNTLRDQGDLANAEASYRAAIFLNSNFAEAYTNLGKTLLDLGRLEEAESYLRSALRQKPNLIETQKLFIHCICLIKFESVPTESYSIIETALAEVWERPAALSKLVSGIILNKCEIIKRHTNQLKINSYEKTYIFDTEFLLDLEGNKLLILLLRSTPVVDWRLESFLTSIRKSLLAVVCDRENYGFSQNLPLTFFCALANQSYINEYVFYTTDEEAKEATLLKNALENFLENKLEVSPLLVIVVACYFPLHLVEGVGELLQRSWPNEVERLLTQQIREPVKELEIQKSIPQITTIKNYISFEVRKQYEENPYPRWINAPVEIKQDSIQVFLRKRFSHINSFPLECEQAVSILIAGCGTGQHPIQTAQLFPKSQILAVDLSIKSLSYAKRKSEEMSINNVEYGQADILELDVLERKFHIIESVGVLHHLERPFEGWKLLVSLMHPNAIMNIGLYSEVARCHITAVREFIAQNQIDASPENIKKVRRALIEFDRDGKLDLIDRTHDFYSLSACRDLLFHAQEQRVTIEEISDFLKNNDLRFIGFELPDPAIKRAYHARFPDDSNATNLENWHLFEKENPKVFLGMYQFWLQKIS